MLSVLVYPTVDQLDSMMQIAVEHLQILAGQRNLQVSGDLFGIFHGPVTPENSGPLEICLPVDALTGPADDIRSYRLAGGTAATVTVFGTDTAFPTILSAYDQTYDWIERAGYRQAGPPREVWHVLPWASEPAVMTIAWPYLSA